MTSLPKNPIIGLAQLAEILGRTELALRTARKKGRLPIQSTRIGNVLVFSRADVEAFKASYRPGRGPAKAKPR